ncbi:hypothetical protein A2801_04445 [Candidatus Woesebacteria bacterium RIFCSPHIGHO2_01_FULL_41_10]|uniref:Uncharacterized protein n=1 Tax=Candidatus Woesebacteria bacterium RIFCSPHIGHO2_01_FULL_41_10 TaxID=1802500 RepID=A0A1F7YNZ6_9BACT|nr:MAG: hypothetical protein A2801_04445 [Candidatus Woesebacteria bacterium RIFCSPHIGHO2_01_FULL_41_10]
MSPAEYEPVPQPSEPAEPQVAAPEQSETASEAPQPEEQGVVQSPSAAQSLTDDQGNVVASAIPVDPEPFSGVQVIPADPEVIHESATSKDYSNAKTWWGQFWERMINQAKLLHKQIVIGNREEKK